VRWRKISEAEMMGQTVKLVVFKVG
jgi:hypothetical protein